MGWRRAPVAFCGRHRRHWHVPTSRVRTVGKVDKINPPTVDSIPKSAGICEIKLYTGDWNWDQNKNAGGHLMKWAWGNSPTQHHSSYMMSVLLTCFRPFSLLCTLAIQSSSHHHLQGWVLTREQQNQRGTIMETCNEGKESSHKPKKGTPTMCPDPTAEIIISWMETSTY